MAIGLIVLLASLGAGQAPGCTVAELQSLDAAEQAIADGGEVAVAAGAGACEAVRLVAIAERGWNEARTLAPRGGDRALLGPAMDAIETLDPLRAGALALEAEYAQVAIRAAIAAAQDERPEMELLLTHARDLSERLQLRGRHARWPRPFNLLAGELWFEVDRYAEARDAFARAAAAQPSPRALVGLGQALARLDRLDEACRTVRQVSGAAGAVRTAAAELLRRCP
jgi:tetratricopeptide (TPR) repeat protein